MAINWYLCSEYFHILVWDKKAIEKDEAANGNSRYVHGIFLRAELLCFVSTMVLGKDRWKDWANLVTGVSSHLFHL